MDVLVIPSGVGELVMMMMSRRSRFRHRVLRCWVDGELRRQGHLLFLGLGEHAWPRDLDFAGPVCRGHTAIARAARLGGLGERATAKDATRLGLAGK